MKKQIKIKGNVLKEYIDRTTKQIVSNILNEGRYSYKGFKCVNVSDDPSFPSYEIISPDGKSIGSTLFPSEMKEIVDGFLKESKTRKKAIKESIAYDDYSAISDLLAKCGWAYSDAYDVRNRNTGQLGVRYIIEPYPNNLEGVKPCKVKDLKQIITQYIGEQNILFSEGQHSKYPEMRNLSMVVFGDEEIHENKKLNEEYYPEDDDMMDDYYYGAMFTFEIEGILADDLSQETLQALQNTKEEYCENSNSYCSVMVTKVDVKPDETGDWEIKVEAAVSAPEMPIDAIEEDATDQIWYWFEEKTKQRAIHIQIIDEREVFDYRTEKYK